MTRTLLTFIAVLLAACSSTTGPKGLDPTVLITNQTAADTLFFTWRDGQGTTGSVTVLPGGSSCTRFVAQADSAYFDAHTTNPQFNTAATYTAPWFDPTARPNWTMLVGDPRGAPFIQVELTQTAPC